MGVISAEASEAVDPEDPTTLRARLGTVARVEVLKQIDEEVREGDVLKPALQQEYLQMVADLASSKALNLEQSERDAIIAIRKEFLRRGLTIGRLFKDLNKLDRYIDMLQREGDDLAKNLIMKNELNKQYLQVVNQAKRQNAEALHRNTYLEAKAMNAAAVSSFAANSENVLNAAVKGTAGGNDATFRSPSSAARAQMSSQSRESAMRMSKMRQDEMVNRLS